jgi:hypothetical protein
MKTASSAKVSPKGPLWNEKCPTCRILQHPTIVGVEFRNAESNEPEVIWDIEKGR